MMPNDHEHGFENTVDISNLPRLDRRDWRWLWIGGYYDGPLDGMVLYNGQQYWAEMVDECSEIVADGSDTKCGYYRLYRLIRLTDAAHAECVRRHEIFCQYVGSHWDYGEDGRRNAGAVKPQSEWHKFYDQAGEWPTWTPAGESVALIYS